MTDKALREALVDLIDALQHSDLGMEDFILASYHRAQVALSTPPEAPSDLVKRLRDEADAMPTTSYLAPRATLLREAADALEAKPAPEAPDDARLREILAEEFVKRGLDDRVILGPENFDIDGEDAGLAALAAMARVRDGT